MGKVVKIVAVVAIAAAIAVAAPYLAGFIAAAGTATFTATAAAIGLALSAGAATVLKALAGAPSATRSFHPASIRLIPTAETIKPRSPGRWADPLFLPWERYAIEATTGDCMAPFVRGGWAVVDRSAEVRAGDFIFLRVRDQRRYYMPSWRRISWQRFWWWLFAPPMGKRFIGVHEDTVMFECTNPPTYMETPLAGVDVLYRVRAVRTTFIAALRAYWTLRSDPTKFDDHIAQATEAAPR